MKISGKPLLNINHLHCKNEKYSRFYREKTAFSPDFSAILLKTLQVGLILLDEAKTTIRKQHKTNKEMVYTFFMTVFNLKVY
jgi:hypothetical protein